MKKKWLTKLVRKPKNKAPKKARWDFKIDSIDWSYLLRILYEEDINIDNIIKDSDLLKLKDIIDIYDGKTQYFIQSITNTGELTHLLHPENTYNGEDVNKPDDFLAYWTNKEEHELVYWAYSEFKDKYGKEVEWDSPAYFWEHPDEESNKFVKITNDLIGRIYNTAKDKVGSVKLGINEDLFSKDEEPQKNNNKSSKNIKKTKKIDDEITELAELVEEIPTKTKSSRKAPNKPAKTFETGTIKTSENDGRDYIVKEYTHSNKSTTWKKWVLHK